MDRTLFSPSMIEAFRACRKAYETALADYPSSGRRSVPSICKQFLRRGIAEINRGKIANPNQVQTFMGQHWPLELIEASGADGDSVAKAFLYCYKTLLSYARRPYRPHDAEVVAVALKARSRVPQARVYLEDTFDLILWYPNRKHLEIIEYQLRAQKTFSAAWPSVSALTKRFLSERLRVRWPFESVSFTTIQIGPSSVSTSNSPVDESIFKLHFEDLTKDLELMKCPQACNGAHSDEGCKYCQSLNHRFVRETEENPFLSLSA